MQKSIKASLSHGNMSQAMQHVNQHLEEFKPPLMKAEPVASPTVQEPEGFKEQASLDDGSSNDMPNNSLRTPKLLQKYLTDPVVKAWEVSMDEADESHGLHDVQMLSIHTKQCCMCSISWIGASLHGMV